MKPNPGYLPPEAIGKRVRVRVAGDPVGRITGEWPADGRAGCSWARRGTPYDIAEYEVIG